MTLSKAILATAFLTATGLAMAQGPGTQLVDPNRVVFVVNGEEVKGAEYYWRMEHMQGVVSRSTSESKGDRFSELTPGYLTIQQLIYERMIFELAKQKGVAPTEDEVEAEFKVRQTDNPKLLEKWTAAGGNMDELKYLLRFQLADFKIRTLGITKTDSEVEQFYQDHPGLYTVPKQFKLRLIAVASADDVKAVDDDLAAGKDFGSVATARSVDSSKISAGEYGTVSEDRLDGAALETLSTTKVGQTTKWLTTSPGGGKGIFFKFLLEGITPPKKLDFDPALMRTIRRRMMIDIGMIKNSGVNKELAALRSSAKIEIKQSESSDPSKLVDPNRIICVINGEEIKGDEYYRRMESLEGVGIRVGNSFSELPPGFVTIRQLIRERLICSLAKEEGVYPTDEEVNSEIEIRQKDNPKLVENWLASGNNIDELKNLLRVEISQFKVQTFGITITNTEVENEYKDHSDRYTKPKQFKLRMIAVLGDQKQTVDQELASGKAFGDVAKELSLDVTRTIGGECGLVPEYDLSTELRTALTATKIGQTTKDWLKFSNDAGGTVISLGNGSAEIDGGRKGADAVAYAKYLLEDVTPSKKIELDASLRRVIRRELMLERGLSKNGGFEKQADQRLAKAKIDIKQAELADAYLKYLHAYLKQLGIN